MLWAHRDRFVARVGLAVASAVTGCWAVTLLAKAGGWYLGLGVAVLVASIIAGLGLLFADKLPAKLAPAAALALGLRGSQRRTYRLRGEHRADPAHRIDRHRRARQQRHGRRQPGRRHGDGRGGMQPPRGHHLETGPARTGPARPELPA